MTREAEKSIAKAEAATTKAKDEAKASKKALIDIGVKYNGLKIRNEKRKEEAATAAAATVPTPRARDAGGDPSSGRRFTGPGWARVDAQAEVAKLDVQHDPSVLDGATMVRPSAMGDAMDAACFPGRTSAMGDAMVADEWFSRDPVGLVQGPFTLLKLDRWLLKAPWMSELMVWRASELCLPGDGVLLKAALAANAHLVTKRVHFVVGLDGED